MTTPLPTLGQLRRIDARKVWQHEAQHFTPWVRDNLTTLCEALQLELELPQTEVAVGPFSCDVLAHETGTDHVAIIENQLEPTDHGHLGQLLTYAAGLDARYIIWIAPQFRPEHRHAIDWLNGHTSEDLRFFGVEVELLQIDDSKPAVHFKLASHPNDWQKAVQARKTEAGSSERALLYQGFLAEVLAQYKDKYPALKSANKASAQNWLVIAGAGRPGFNFYVWLSQAGQISVALWIETPDGEANKRYFDQLFDERGAIEAEVGQPLKWERLDERKTSRFGMERPGRVTDAEPLRREHIAWAVNAVATLRRVLEPRVRGLQLDPVTPVADDDELLNDSASDLTAARVQSS